jgi:IclR family mhp operon transcriptional activator
MDTAIRSHGEHMAEETVSETAIATHHTSVHRRTNSRRGSTNPLDRSYPPVNAVCRALQILNVANQKSIATVNSIHTQTGIPQPTIVRMLETLMHEGYVVRDNMCGGYRVTRKVAELSAGYSGISRVIEIARPLAIGLTRQIKWPIGLGEIDGDAVEIRYWTGTISPVVHTNTVLGKRADLLTSAMGRAYMAFCSDDERDRHIRDLRETLPEFGASEEVEYRELLDRVRRSELAMRVPGTGPTRMTTYSVPILENDKVAAVMSVSFFTSSVPQKDVRKAVLDPLIETRINIEHALAFISNRPNLEPSGGADYEVGL